MHTYSFQQFFFVVVASLTFASFSSTEKFFKLLAVTLIPFSFLPLHRSHFLVKCLFSLLCPSQPNPHWKQNLLPPLIPGKLFPAAISTWDGFFPKHPQSYPVILQNHSYPVPWLDISNGQMLGSWCADSVCLHAYQLFRSCFALHHLSISIWCLLSYSLDLSSGSGDHLLIFFAFC